jgi:hypothetical protein
MKALIYLLGARALDLARERDDTRPRIAEVLPGPLATTTGTAAAWRQWSQQAGPTSPVATTRSPRTLLGTRATRQTSG